MTVTDRLVYSRRLVVDTQTINPNKLKMNPKGRLPPFASQKTAF